MANANEPPGPPRDESILLQGVPTAQPANAPSSVSFAYATVNFVTYAMVTFAALVFAVFAWAALT